MSETIKLLPCPFCGQQEIYLNAPSQHWPQGSINCPGCMAVLPGAIGGKDQYDELIKCWNARTPAPDAVREALEDIISSSSEHETENVHLVSSAAIQRGAAALSKPAGEE